MTRNRFNQAKHQGASSVSSADRWLNLTLSKARGLFLEDNGNIDIKESYKVTNVHPHR